MNLLIEQGAKGDSSLVLLRSKLRAVSRRMGFSEVKREQMELVCNEMVTNQNKFAEGNGLVQIWEVDGPVPALDLFAFDYGNGIPNIEVALKDGFTTARTMGKGLGAISRLSSQNEFYSIPADNVMDSPWHGVAIWARFYRDQGALPRLPHEAGRYNRAYHDSPFNGDLLSVRADHDKTRWLHMDGLGHGREAEEVVRGLGEILNQDMTIEGYIQTLNDRLRGSRGAVALICEIENSSQTLKIGGVGDMAAHLIVSGDKKTISFSPGVLGHAHRTPEVSILSFPPQALLITASDGLRRSMSLRTFPELWRLHPQMVALFLGQVMGRHNDDRSVFTIRLNQTSEENHG